jgi:prepilin-type N-terminal cleavage/methylation domain-containing protein
MLKKLFMKRLGKNQKGVTLIELMAVIVILGIVAAVAGAAVTGAFSSAKTNADKATTQILTDAASRYLLENPKTADYTFNVRTDLLQGGYINNLPEPQADTTKKSFSITYSNTNKTVTVAPAAAIYP